MSLIGLLVVVLVVCIVVWLCNMLLGAFGVGDPIRTVVFVLVVLVCLVWLLSAFGVGVPGLRLR